MSVLLRIDPAGPHRFSFSFAASPLLHSSHSIHHVSPICILFSFGQFPRSVHARRDQERGRSGDIGVEGGDVGEVAWRASERTSHVRERGDVWRRWSIGQKAAMVQRSSGRSAEALEAGPERVRTWCECGDEEMRNWTGDVAMPYVIVDDRRTRRIELREMSRSRECLFHLFLMIDRPLTECMNRSE